MFDSLLNDVLKIAGSGALGIFALVFLVKLVTQINHLIQNIKNTTPSNGNSNGSGKYVTLAPENRVFDMLDQMLELLRNQHALLQKMEVYNERNQEYQANVMAILTTTLKNQNKGS